MRYSEFERLFKEKSVDHKKTVLDSLRSQVLTEAEIKKIVKLNPAKAEALVGGMQGKKEIMCVKIDKKCYYGLYNKMQAVKNSIRKSKPRNKPKKPEEAHTNILKRIIKPDEL